MALDNKYGHVTTEFGDIGKDEPVVVFRAQDGVLPRLMSYYLLLCSEAGSPRFHLNLILDSNEKIKEWQNNNSLKVRPAPTSSGPAGLRYKNLNS